MSDAERGGAPVLKGEASWRTVCGLMLRGRTWSWVFQFRGFSR